QLLDYLERGKTVVLEFGRYRSNGLAQVLVANMLSRRIYARWADAVEKALAEKSKPPPQLVITLEEAHKFLNPRMAGQTIFGEIAREMRKYNVTLLVVDQRPSAIDSEVLSQIGTKITCLLEDDKDVSAVLAGTSGSAGLRGVLARLESKQQALIFGHAVPMPVVVRTRDYGSTPESYASFGFQEGAALARQAERDARDLMGE
ncbi:MAG: ATP-binding protein, partial [Chloroflexota bacterium]